MYFPTICVDNFFDDPDAVRNLALSLEYKSTSNIPWPGKRSRPINQISPVYFDQFCKKLMSLSFNLKKEQDLSWRVETYFQMIEPDQYEHINQGWVHIDDSTYAGLVYLNPSISADCGTSIFKPKSIGTVPIHLDVKHEMFLNFDKNKSDFYNTKLTENNSQYEETIKFSNIYNRLIAYDGSQHHGVTKFVGPDRQPRLTQVFFVKEISSSHFPIPSARQIQI